MRTGDIMFLFTDITPFSLISTRFSTISPSLRIGVISVKYQLEFEQGDTMLKV